MKKILLFAAVLIGIEGFAQSPIKKMLDRYEDPEKGQVTFIEKGNHALGISGSYRDFNVAGEGIGDGFQMLTLLSLGNGQLQLWNVSPSFSYFVADDLSIGLKIGYNGYNVNTNLALDLRDMIGGKMLSLLSGIGGDESGDDNSGNDDGTDGGASLDPEMMAVFNVPISNRHMHSHSGLVALTARKYISFFGSKMVGVFGEGRLSGRYGTTTSYPVPNEGEDIGKIRTTQSWGVGFDIAGGLAIKLRDNSAITISVPVVGVDWRTSTQENKGKAITNHSRVNSFQIARDIDLMGIQFGYVRYIGPRKK